MNIWNRLTCSAVSHVKPSVNNCHMFAIPAIMVIQSLFVLLSFKFNMNFFFFLHIVNYSVLLTSYFYIFLLVVVFVFSHSSIPA